MQPVFYNQNLQWFVQNKSLLNLETAVDFQLPKKIVVRKISYMVEKC